MPSISRPLSRLARLPLWGLQHASPPRLSFLHFEKCGGTSLTEALKRYYGAWPILCPSSFVLLDHPASLEGAKRVGEPLFAYRQQLLSYYLARRDVYMVAGHFQVDRGLLDAFGESHAFVTVMRNPVERWISHYLFNRFKPGKHQKIEVDVEEYLSTTRGRMLGQDYVRLLTGQGDYAEGTRLAVPTEDELERARQTLSCFAVVGVLEQMEMTSERFRRRFGAPLRVPRRNASPAPTGRAADIFSSDVRRRVEEVCAPNLKMYELALTMG